jgi:hypothetical protein
MCMRNLNLINYFKGDLNCAYTNVVGKAVGKILLRDKRMTNKITIDN